MSAIYQTSPPPTGTPGALWIDANTGTLFFDNGAVWVQMAGAVGVDVPSPPPPSTLIVEDFETGNRFSNNAGGSWIVSSAAAKNGAAGMSSGAVGHFMAWGPNAVPGGPNAVIRGWVRVAGYISLVGFGWATGANATEGVQVALDTRSGGLLSLRRNGTNQGVQNVPFALNDPSWYWLSFARVDEATFVAEVWDEPGGSLLISATRVELGFGDLYPALYCYSANQYWDDVEAP